MMEGSVSFSFLFATLFACCLLFTVILNSILLKFLRTLGTKNQPGKVMVRWGAQSKPAIGGISFFIAFLLTLVAGAIIAEDQILSNLQLIGWVLAASLAFITGLWDDAFNTNPLLKFIAQSLCALILISSGTSIELFDLDILNYALTFIWIIGLMNSINMLDNMDAITTIVSLFILVFFQLVLALQGHISSYLMVVFLGLTATLLGFLVHNWHPSKLYMGDSGSQFLGLVLGAGAIHLCWNYPFSSPEIVDPRNIILPAVVFLLPIADTTLVSVNRILHKRSPFVGGRDHSTHNFSYLGMRDDFVAVSYSFFSMIQIVLAMGLVLFITEWTISWTLVYSAYIAFFIFTLFFIARKNMKLGKYNYE